MTACGCGPGPGAGPTAVKYSPAPNSSPFGAKHRQEKNKFELRNTVSVGGLVVRPKMKLVLESNMEERATARLAAGAEPDV